MFCRLSRLRSMSYSPRVFNHRSRLGLCWLHLSVLECLTSFADDVIYYTSADFCPAVRLPLGSLSRRSETGQISRGNSSRLLCTVAESTLRILDGLWTSQYVARSSDAHALYSVLVHRLALLLDASFRPRLAAIALASSVTLHLHQVA